MAIRKIDKSEIDFSKIYGTSGGAINQNGNTVSVNQDYWGDNDELTFNDETGLVSEGGVGLGFINQNDIISINKVGNTGSSQNSYNGSYRDDSSIMQEETRYNSNNGFAPGNSQSPTVSSSDAYDPSIGKGVLSDNSENNDIKPIKKSDSNTISSNNVTSSVSSNDSVSSNNTVSNNEIKPINKANESSSSNSISSNSVSSNNTVSNNEIKPINKANESLSSNSISSNSVSSNNIAKPSDFNFKHKDSNMLAAMAKNMGFTDEQIKVAIGISRHETGNYEHLAGGYNYGGVSGKGDAGSMVNSDGHVYAKYSSKEKGMEAFLTNLKKKYFDQDLNTPDSIARKYLGHSNTSNWISGVKGCMK